MAAVCRPSRVVAPTWPWQTAPQAGRLAAPSLESLPDVTAARRRAWPARAAETAGRPALQPPRGRLPFPAGEAALFYEELEIDNCKFPISSHPQAAMTARKASQAASSTAETISSPLRRRGGSGGGGNGRDMRGRSCGAGGYDFGGAIWNFLVSPSSKSNTSSKSSRRSSGVLRISPTRIRLKTISPKSLVSRTPHWLNTHLAI